MQLQLQLQPRSSTHLYTDWHISSKIINTWCNTYKPCSLYKTHQESLPFIKLATNIGRLALFSLLKFTSIKLLFIVTLSTYFIYSNDYSNRYMQNAFPVNIFMYPDSLHSVKAQILLSFNKLISSKSWHVTAAPDPWKYTWVWSNQEFSGEFSLLWRSSICILFMHLLGIEMWKWHTNYHKSCSRDRIPMM